MKYLKHIIAFVLCITVLCVPFVFSSASATASGGSFAGVGEYTTHLIADPTTSTPPSHFGSVDANGKVWVDKSVEVNKDHFEITLSALAQEYISEDETVTINGPAADVEIVGVWKYEKIQKPDNSTDTPALGDNFHIESFIILFIISLITLIILTIFKKKRVRI